MNKTINKIKKNIASLLVVAMCIQSVTCYQYSVRAEETNNIGNTDALNSTTKLVKDEKDKQTRNIETSQDFINLSNMDAYDYQYDDIIITRTGDVSFDLTGNYNGKTFRGLGSEDYPFMGTISITNYESGIDIPVGRAFFNYLDQSASIGAGFYLVAKKDMTDNPLLADYYTNEKETTAGNISLIMDVKTDGADYYPIGGIIGAMTSGSELNLSVENQVPVDGNLEVKNSDNLGFFCNTMGADTTLTISAYSGDQGFSIESTGGHAGGFVGKMENGSTLNINASFALTGNVTAGADEKYAGGVIGEATNGHTNFNSSVVIQGTVSGKQGSAGLIGNALYSGENDTIDLSNLTISNNLDSGVNAGGLFGKLTHSGTGTLTINNAAEETFTHMNESSNCGGLIGVYSSDYLSGALVINQPDVTIAEKGTVTNFGGVIGSVIGISASYVEINGAEISTQGNGTFVASSGVYGGIAGLLNSSGHFINITGNVKITGKAINTPTYMGGIIGKSEYGVVRLSGTTDLSGLTFNLITNNSGQIGGNNAGTIIYALGSGEGDGLSAYGWKLVRPSAGYTLSDLGSYGEVVRLNGTTLTEEVREGSTYITPDATDASRTTEVFSFYSDMHTLVPCINYSGTGAYEINNLRDAVVFAVTTQYANNNSNGTVVKCGIVGNNLLNKNINLNADIDFSGTGIIGLTRDNASQSYTGTLEGNHHKITLAIGEQYAKVDGNEEGNGTIYNHETPAFVGKLGSASAFANIKNLTFDGIVEFGLPANGKVDVRSGAVAGYTYRANIENVTVDADIVYSGVSRDNMKTAYVGGFIGNAVHSNLNPQINFKNCNMTGDITVNSDGVNNVTGGFIGFINSDNGSCGFVFDNCTIKDMTIMMPSEITIADAKMGGLIGSTLDSNSKIILTDLLVDHCKIENLASTTSGGLLGYSWIRTDVEATGVVVKNSKVTTGTAVFGGLVYQTGGYWKVARSEDDAKAGIEFAKDESANTFTGGSGNSGASGLLAAITSNGSYGSYIELGKDAYVIDADAVVVNLNNNETKFDDIVGRTKYSSNNNSVVSIGLTKLDASEVVKVDLDSCNTWKNKCSVNGNTSYTNSETRYYYNVDYYRNKENLNSDSINTPGRMLLWSLYTYSSALSNVKSYFKDGTTITGDIDLTGVSYYPVAPYVTIANPTIVTIKDATITFAYSDMNAKEDDDSNKEYDDSTSQHYQMHTGIFTTIAATDRTGTSLSVDGLELRGNFGKYTDSKAGVLVCDSISGKNAIYTVKSKISNVNLNGIQCANKANLPLLINTITGYTSTSLSNVYTSQDENATSKYTTDGTTKTVANSLIGKVGSTTAEVISIDFSEMGLDSRTEAGTELMYGTYQTIFSVATFMEEFQYSDSSSGGSYNFERDANKITYGKEISNTESGRNKYNDGITSQYCYFDTYGTTDYVIDLKGTGTETKPIAERFATGYRPYVGKSENYNGQNTYHEIDVNQKAYFISEGCGTYSHPWVIKSVDGSGAPSVSANDQLNAIRDLLEGQGNGTVLMLNKTVISNGKGTVYEHNTALTATDDDQLYIKNGGDWYEAELKDGRYSKTENAKSVSDSVVNAYVRNGYFSIEEDITVDLSVFNGIGGNSTNKAFSGVIVGKQKSDETYPTLTLTVPEGKALTEPVNSGLIRYSQGSVVKNLNIVFDDVTISSSDDYQTPTGFGGVIGWIIGGDNVIDNVTVNNSGISVTGTNNKLVAVGGYVGYVGGNDCLKGGGIIFRNINCEGLTSVTDEVGGRSATVATNTEVEAGNDHYYWNPYVGRVLDAYACTACTDQGYGNMGDNTDKNYKIPKLTASTTISIKNKVSVSKKENEKTFNYVTQSEITVQSAQDLWVLSSIVNSGAGCRATNDKYNEGTGAQAIQITAYYFGRCRSGSYDGVGTTTISDSDKLDEESVWGGIGSLYPEKSFLATYTNNPEAAALLSIDASYRMLSLTAGTYDLTVYGNGFKGIGESYFYDGTQANGSQSGNNLAQKVRVLRLGGTSAFVGNDSIISYKRNIYEYEDEPGETVTKDTAGKTTFFCPYTVKQAGLFPVYNQRGADVTIKDVTLKYMICSNQTRIPSTFDTKVEPYVYCYSSAFGGFYGRAVYNWSNSTKFSKVKVEAYDGNTNSSITNACYAGGIVGYVWSNTANNFENCSVNKLEITNAVYAGGLGAHIYSGANQEINNCIVKNTSLNRVTLAGLFLGRFSSSLYLNGGSVEDCSITLDKKTNQAVNGGGFVGFGGVSLFINNYANSTDSECTITDLTIDGTGIGNNTGWVGGIIGYIKERCYVYNASVNHATLITRGHVGGIAGSFDSNQTRTFSNVAVTNSKIVTTYDGGSAGGFVGYNKNASAVITGCNILSGNNIVGYLVKDNKIDTNCNGIKVDTVPDLTKLSAENIGKRTNSSAYLAYSNIISTTKFFNADRVGIWIGDSTNCKIDFIAASRQGNYSAIADVGYAGTTNANNSVIYADYTGVAETAKDVGGSPDIGITMGAFRLTSDGAGIVDGSAISQLIIDDTADLVWSKGYYGGKRGTIVSNVTYDRTLDELVSSFDSTLISTYKTEESTSDYALVDGAEDFSMLVLQANTSEGITPTLNHYISLLTNKDQKTVQKYVTITPTTYVYRNDSWQVADKQSMKLKNGELVINSGQFDNTKNQITILDVAYSVDATYLASFGGTVSYKKLEYHLYIPVLVKKVMDVSFEVKVANGASGYDSAYAGTMATLASFGEDFTANITYNYEWTVGEWNNALASGENLLWNFDKQVDIGNLTGIEKTDIHLTLVDLNTRGAGVTFFKSDGSVLDENNVLDFRLIDSSYKSAYMCDLLDLKVSDNLGATGTYKKTTEDASDATIRVWNETNCEYDYYTIVTEEDTEISETYNISLNTALLDDETLKISEEYYLVINCTDGTGMYNEKIELPSAKITGGQIPTKLKETDRSTAIYVLGDFYTIAGLNLTSKARVENSQVMTIGSNDYISVELVSDIQSGADDTFTRYVNTRPVYYRYALQLINEEGAPVDITTNSITITSLSIGEYSIPKVENLSSEEEGFTMTLVDSVLYIDVKTCGKKYIDKIIKVVVVLNYEEPSTLISQFPVRTDVEGVQEGVQFKASSAMAYQRESIGSSNMSLQIEPERKFYYTEETSKATLSYDSYNIASTDGNASQLGLNGREIQDEDTLITSRAIYNASYIAGINKTDNTNSKYPYYLEGTLSLGKKTEEDNVSGIGKKYEDVDIGLYLSDFIFESDENEIDTNSDGLGIQADGTYKFRIILSQTTVNSISSKPILVNIEYRVKTGSGLEKIDGSQYSNYKVTLSAGLTNKNGEALINSETDYLIYTNAKIYLGIIGITDVDSK